MRSATVHSVKSQRWTCHLTRTAQSTSNGKLWLAAPAAFAPPIAMPNARKATGKGTASVYAARTWTWLVCRL